MYGDDFKLCCPSILPPRFNPSNCHVTQDTIATCSSLLGSFVYRIYLWFILVTTVLGNVYCLRNAKVITPQSKSCDVFLKQLFVSSGLRGIPLFVVLVVDSVTFGEYLQYDLWWRRGHLCKLSGVLFSVLNMTSLTMIFLISFMYKDVQVFFKFSYLL